MKTLNYEKILGSDEFKPYSNIHYSGYISSLNADNEMIFTPNIKAMDKFGWCSPDKITFKLDVGGIVNALIPINILPSSIIDFILEKYLELKPASWPNRIAIFDPINSENTEKAKVLP